MIQLKSETNIKIPLTYIILGTLAFSIAQIILFIHSTNLLIGNFRVPEIWMGAHVLVLGFAMLVVMGAMYQLVPVVFLTKIWRESFSYIQMTITIVGVILFSILIGINPSNAIIGGLLVVIGFTLFIIQMLVTIFQSKNITIMFGYIVTALCCLFITILLGLLLSYSFAIGGLSFHEPLFYSHIIVGLIGFFTFLIFGFSLKLVPMFSLSHDFTFSYAKWAYCLYSIGLLTLIYSVWIDRSILTIVGFCLLAAGFTFFTMNIYKIYKKRLKRKLDTSFFFTLIALVNGNILHIVALICSISMVSDRKIWSLLIFLYIYCWIIFSIIGYLYKIVPFLWWTYSYSMKIGKEKVPTLKEMINERVGKILFVSFFCSICLFVLSYLIGNQFILIISQVILTITTIVYTLSILHVLQK